MEDSNQPLNEYLSLNYPDNIQKEGEIIKQRISVVKEKTAASLTIEELVKIQNNKKYQMMKKYPFNVVKSLAHKNKFYDPNPEWMNPKWRLQKKFDGVEMEEPPLKLSPSRLDKINELAE